MHKKLENCPIYSMHFYMESFILCNSSICKEKITVVEEKHKEIDSDNITHESMSHLDFDGSVNRLVAGAGVRIYNL